MDVQTIDQAFGQLQGQAQQALQELQALAVKLQAAAQSGDQRAQAWLLDLRSIGLAVRSEQDRVANLLQALHAFVANQSQAQVQASHTQPQQGGIGDLLSSFLNSSFGRALGSGAGFRIGDDLVNKIL
jgi:hypothetical protein